MTDEQLMAKVSQGDSNASEALVRRYEKRIFKFMLGWVKDSEDAWDITQEVLLRICQKAHTFDGRASLTAWVFRVARNLQIDTLRKKNHRVREKSLPLDQFPGLALRSSKSSPENSAFQKETLTRIREAIDALPPRQQEIVKLRLLSDLSLREIAEAAGLSLGGVKSTLHNALHQLRESLEDQGIKKYARL